MWLFILQNVIVLCYSSTYPPFEGRMTNALEIFNELCILFASYHLLTFSDAFVTQDSDEAEERLSDIMGWSLTFLVLGQLTINTIAMLSLSIVANY
jgi:hypothetical protein